MDGDGGLPVCVAHHPAPPRRAFSICRQTRSGVAGPSKPFTSKGASASLMALAMTGNPAMAPASPRPFTPSGLVVRVELGDMRRRREGAVAGTAVADPPAQADIAGHVVIDQHRAIGQRGLRHGDRRQGFVIDVDPLRRVARDHQGDRLPGIAQHPVERQVVDIAALAGQEARILAAPGRFANFKPCHALCLPMRFAFH